MKTFQLRSLRHDRIYHLRADEIRDFYDEHVLGAITNPTRMQVVLNALNRILDSGNGRLNVLERMRVSGCALLELFDRDGELKDVYAGANLVVTTGLNAVIDRLQGTSVGVHDFQALGTGTTAAALGNTTLETELTGGSNARVQGTLSQPTALTDRLVSVFAAGNGTGAVTETGRFTASSGGNMFCRVVFAAVNKSSADSLSVTHDITAS